VLGALLAAGQELHRELAELLLVRALDLGPPLQVLAQFLQQLQLVLVLSREPAVARPN